MSKAFDDFDQHILPYVPKCPSQLAYDHLLKALNYFAERSDALQKSDLDINTTADDSTYQITPDTNKEVIRVLSVRYNNNIVKHKSEDWLNKFYPAWRTNKGDGPMYYMVDRGDSLFGNTTVILVPIPETSETGVLDIRYSYRYTPTIDFATIGTNFMDDDVYFRYRYEFAAGALSTLQMMRNSEWYDPISAAENRMQFLAAVDRARNEARKGFGVSNLTVQMSPLA